MSTEIKTKCLYYSLIFNQQKIFKNEVLEELLRERINYYNSKKIEVNFWIVLLPDLKISQSKNKSFASLISTNKEFITWIKLRLGFFKEIKNIDEIFIESNDYTTDGYFIELDNKTKLFKRIFNNNNLLLNNSYILNQYDTLLNINSKL